MDTNDDVEHDDGQNGSCLICNSKTSLSNTTTIKPYFQHPLNPKSLLKDLHTYFLLKHVLGLSSEQLEDYFRHCPYPADWVKVCSLCVENYVDKCTLIFLELQEAQKKFREARAQIIGVVKRSVENERKSVTFAMDICRRVRQCVSQNSNVDLEDNKRISDKVSKAKGRPSRTCKRISGLTSSARDRAAVPGLTKYVKVRLCEKDVPRHDNGEYPISLDNSEKWDIDNVDAGDPLDDDWNAGESDPESDNDAKKRKRRKNTGNVTAETKKLNGPPKIRRPRKLKEPAFMGENGKVQYRCNYEGCSKILTTHQGYKNHCKRRHTKRDQLEIVCEQCGQRFDKRQGYAVHMFRSHGVRVQNPKKRRVGERKREGEEEEDGGVSQCPHCDKILTSTTGLYQHIQRAHFSKYAFYCEICGKGAINSTDLKYHRVRQHFICAVDGCKVTCDGQKEIWTHHKEVHNTEIGIFGCSECGKFFVDGSYLKEHLELHEYKRRQEEQQPDETVEAARVVVGQYSCDLCGQRFPMRKYLSHHMAYKHRGKVRKRDRVRQAEKEARNIALAQPAQTGITFIASKRGRTLLVNDGVIFHLLSTKNNKSYFRCSSRTKGCKAGIVLDGFIPGTNAYSSVKISPTPHDHTIPSLDEKDEILESV